jgi:asparaginyl-tRNA synthetase
VSGTLQLEVLEFEHFEMAILLAIWVVPRNIPFVPLFWDERFLFYKKIGGRIMETTLVRQLYRETEKYKEVTVKISGWVRTVRASNAFGFIELNDGSFFKSVQVVFDSNLDNFKEISKFNVSSSISVEGTVVLTPDAKQPFEIRASKVVLEGTSDPDYPLQKKKHSLEFLRTIAHLRPRSNTFSAVFRVRSLAAYAIHKFFNERDFVYVHTPLITGSDCEGAGEMFRVTTLDMANPPRDAEGNIDYSKDFFGRGTNLTVSGQLSAETYALAFRNVYTFGPTFRAENSNTARHAAEFWMIEPEMAFAELKDYLDTAEDMVKYIINYVMENAPEEMEFFNKFIDKTLFDRLNNVVNSDFARITYTEAVEILKNSKEEFEYPVEWGIDLQTEHERYLTEKVYKKPVFVTDYPKDIKAFYMRLNDDGKTVAAADLLVPGVGEIIGGSQREERLDVLEKRMEELGLRKEDYWWYLELRKYGGTKHAGYGLGFERMIMYLTGMGNIRDVIPYPRTTGSAEF